MQNTKNSKDVPNLDSKEDPTFKRSYILKIVILGEVNVGKSNIIRRILNKDFQSQEATIGVEFGDLEVFDVDKDKLGVSLKLQLWDTCMVIYDYDIYSFI